LAKSFMRSPPRRDRAGFRGRQPLHQLAQPRRRRPAFRRQRTPQSFADLAAYGAAVDAVDLDAIKLGGIRHGHFHFDAAAVERTPGN
jgi:hypothetical protein